MHRIRGRETRRRLYTDKRVVLKSATQLEVDVDGMDGRRLTNGGRERVRDRLPRREIGRRNGLIAGRGGEGSRTHSCCLRLKTKVNRRKPEARGRAGSRTRVRLRTKHLRLVPDAAARNWRRLLLPSRSVPGGRGERRASSASGTYVPVLWNSLAPTTVLGGLQAVAEEQNKARLERI